ncbi:hypothetical protein [Spirosoma luteum]|uniref:hypothetical protein n=1 Tax=Spirosoma luteum TaxID=431553 RepID=UPI0003705F1E|nr:hypothetical protein [Spirosoma luteum]
MFQFPLSKIPVSLRFLSVSLLAGAALSWLYRRHHLSEEGSKPALYFDQSSEWLGI